LAGKSQRIIALRDNQIVDLDIEEGLACQKELNYELLDAEQMMAI
jgi:hypothetical protein